MIQYQHQVYKCPKCFNTLLVSNKLLHDLRCTEDNPATYENILFRQSQQMVNNPNNNKNSSQRLSSRMSIKNDDGTMIDIIKEKNMKGKEEFIEIKYDPQGNIISRKKAGISDYSSPQNNFHELNDYNYDNDDNNNYENYDNNNNTYYEVNNEVEVRHAPNVIYETAEAQEIIYEAPAKYDPHVTINKPIEETIINSGEGIRDETYNNIIRNTMSQASNNIDNNNNYNIQNDFNINGYDYSQNFSQTNDINSNEYNQSFDMNNFNSGNNDIYSNSFQMGDNHINNGIDDILQKTAGFENLNLNFYDYQH